MLQKSSAAILVIDMQNDFVLPDAQMCVPGAYATLPALSRFLDYGRWHAWAIIYVSRPHLASGIDAEITRRHLFEQERSFCVPGTHGAQVVDTLRPQEGNIIVTKRRFSAFLGTDLDLVLRGLGVNTVYVTGTQYPNCIRATAVDSMSLDYKTIVCEDCCSASTPEVAAANIFDLRNMGIECGASIGYME